MAVLKCLLWSVLLYVAYRLALRALVWAYAKFVADPFLGYRGDKAR